jgi:imidazoleglycerol-phosphate dehydratase
MSRVGTINRTTKETSIDLTIDLDGSGATEISTGIPFYDHMLEQVGKHGGFDLRIAATGDLHIDTHHTVEDVAISLGEAFRQALGDKAGVRRFASGLYPLDEALVEVALDLSGRPSSCGRSNFLSACPWAIPHSIRSWRSTLLRRRDVGGHHVACHLAHRSHNVHHIVEAVFKGLARCLRDAVRIEGAQIPSTKRRAVAP